MIARQIPRILTIRSHVSRWLTTLLQPADVETLLIWLALAAALIDSLVSILVLIPFALSIHTELYQVCSARNATEDRSYDLWIDCSNWSASWSAINGTVAAIITAVISYAILRFLTGRYHYNVTGSPQRGDKHLAATLRALLLAVLLGLALATMCYCAMELYLAMPSNLVLE